MVEVSKEASEKSGIAVCPKCWKERRKLMPIHAVREDGEFSKTHFECKHCGVFPLTEFK